MQTLTESLRVAKFGTAEGRAFALGQLRVDEHRKIKMAVEARCFTLTCTRPHTSLTAATTTPMTYVAL